MSESLDVFVKGSYGGEGVFLCVSELDDRGMSHRAEELNDEAKAIV